MDASSWKTGEHFNYQELFEKIFDLNTKPDVRINTRLLPKVDENGKRTVDVELNVIDKFPLHGSLNLTNTGIDETSDYRLRSTLQHSNLSHKNDILTFEWLTDPKEVQTVNALSSSYGLPLGKDYRLTLFGGWSKSEISDIFSGSGIDVFGEGYYLGTQFSKVLISNDKFSLDSTYGWMIQSVENFNDFGQGRKGF